MILSCTYGICTKALGPLADRSREKCLTPAQICDDEDARRDALVGEPKPINHHMCLHFSRISSSGPVVRLSNIVVQSSNSGVSCIFAKFVSS